MTSALRGSDVIDADFEHVDEQGHAIPRHAPAKAVHNDRIHRKPIEFGDSGTEGSRGLDVFADKSSPLDRRQKFPFLGLAVIGVVVGLAGFWLAGGEALVVNKKGPQAAPALTQSMQRPTSEAGIDAVQTGDIVSNPSPSVLEVAPIADVSAGHQTKGSLIYVRATKKRPVAIEGKAKRRPVSPSQRSQKDLTISLAGGSSGR